MLRGTLKFAKKVIYSLDRILLGRSISRFVNESLMQNVLRSNFEKSSGSVQVQFFTKVSALTDLADKYKTDKGGDLNVKKGPRGTHSYSYYYEELFSHCRLSVERVFECGIGTNFEDTPSNMSMQGTPGASLKMWEEYFPNAEIVGVDIDDRVLFTTERVNTYKLDQTNSAEITELFHKIGGTKFDLMIDDGLHTFEAAKCLFENSHTQLKDGGVYVIEDISPWNLTRYVDWLHALDFNFSLVPLFGLKAQPSDDFLIVIRNNH